MIPADNGISLLGLPEREAGTGLFRFLPESIPKTVKINFSSGNIQFLLQQKLIPLPAIRSTANFRNQMEILGT